MTRPFAFALGRGALSSLLCSGPSTRPIWHIEVPGVRGHGHVLKGLEGGTAQLYAEAGRPLFQRGSCSCGGLHRGRCEGLGRVSEGVQLAQGLLQALQGVVR
jgi:hypothetical protein